MSATALLRAEDLAAWLEAQLPLGSGRFQLAPGASPDEGLVFENEQGGLSAVIRLIVWDDDGESRSVRDVREQHVVLVPAALRDEPERVRTFVGAWAALMPEVLERLGDEAQLMMPHELVDFSALKLARAETADDFRRALLAKGRYGRFFAAPRRPLRLVGRFVAAPRGTVRLVGRFVAARAAPYASSAASSPPRAAPYASSAASMMRCTRP